MAAPPTPRLDTFEEAVEFFRTRLKLTDRQLRAIVKRTTRRAVTAAKLHQLRAADAVMKGIGKAVAEGKTLAETRAGLSRAVQRHVEGDPLELMFRNGIQASYSAGRIRQFLEPDTLEMRPFWLFDAIMDGRTTDICRTCNGVILPADAAWWTTHIPPLHHRCRSAVRSLTEEDAEARGVTRRPTRMKPADGWGAIPPDDPAKADLDDVDPRLRKAHRKRR